MAKQKMKEDALEDGNPTGEQARTSTCQSSASPVVDCAQDGKTYRVHDQ